jgi:hypothetical protein
VIGLNLTIDELIVPGSKALYGRYEGDFRGISHPMKHGFPKKNLTQSHAIKTSDQNPFLPCFKGVSDPLMMQDPIGFLYRRADPSAFAIPPWPSTGRHHGFKGPIMGDLPQRLSTLLPKTF